MAHGGRRQADEKILTVLACGATVECAAREAGVSPRTVHRRLEDPAFRRRLQAAKSDLSRRSTDMLTAGALEAGKTLLTLVQPSMPPAVRLGAARAILENGMRMRQLGDLEERLAALEEQVAAPRG